MTISKPWFWGTPILGNLQWILSIHCKDSPKIGVQTAETVTIGGCGECLAPVAVQNKEHVQLHWAVINRSMSILVDGTYTNIITKSSWSITMVLINQQWQPNTTGRAAHCREFYTCFFFVLYEPLLTNRHRMAGFWRLHGADKPPGFGVWTKPCVDIPNSRVAVDDIHIFIYYIYVIPSNEYIHRHTMLRRVQSTNQLCISMLVSESSWFCLSGMTMTQFLEWLLEFHWDFNFLKPGPITKANLLKQLVLFVVPCCNMTSPTLVRLRTC